MSDIEYSVITSDVIKSFDCTMSHLKFDISNQKSIDFLLNPFFVFPNDLYENLLHNMYTCCYSKMK